MCVEHMTYIKHVHSVTYVAHCYAVLPWYAAFAGGYIERLNLETYRGDVVLQQHPKDASKSIYSYKATVIAKDPSQARTIYDTLHQQYTTTLLPGLAKVGGSSW
jgi:hypothetical protein